MTFRPFWSPQNPPPIPRVQIRVPTYERYIERHITYQFFVYIWYISIVDGDVLEGSGIRLRRYRRQRAQTFDPPWQPRISNEAAFWTDRGIEISILNAIEQGSAYRQFVMKELGPMQSDCGRPQRPD